MNDTSPMSWLDAVRILGADLARPAGMFPGRTRLLRIYDRTLRNRGGSKEVVAEIDTARFVVDTADLMTSRSCTASTPA